MKQISYLVGEEESYFVCYHVLVIKWLLFGEISCPLGAQDGLHYSIVTLLVFYIKSSQTQGQ